MLESILLETGSETLTLNFANLMACSLASVALGIIIAGCYMLCSERYSKNFVVTLAVLPILVQSVIMMVNGNLGTGVAILGAFGLVRFRSIPGNAKEIGTVFFAMATGLSTGMGYIGYAVLITIIVAGMFIILSKVKFGDKKEIGKQLRITVPENINYTGLFDDIFDKYANSAKLDRVKTTNLGSMFELTYLIEEKDESREKEMIDLIRTRNGNLTVLCGRLTTPSEEL